MKSSLQETFGNIDIYLFDQLLKSRFDNCKNVIDIGCGGGRNMIWFLRNEFNVFGIDRDPGAIENVRSLAQEINPGIPSGNFVVGSAEEIPFPLANFDLVICSAVFHFATDEAHFEKMLRSAWNMLRPGGYFFARLASDIGIESLVQSLGSGRYLLPDGSVRFLVNEQMLYKYTQALKGELFEPIKTTNVSNLRCMTTWCMQKK